MCCKELGIWFDNRGRNHWVSDGKDDWIPKFERFSHNEIAGSPRSAEIELPSIWEPRSERKIPHMRHLESNTGGSRANQMVRNGRACEPRAHGVEEEEEELFGEEVE